MAFDLNKNDGTKIDPSAKKGTPSKFDLSKNDSADSEPPSKPWIIVVLAALVIVGGIWYYLSDPKIRENAPTEIVNSDSLLKDTLANVIQQSTSKDENDIAPASGTKAELSEKLNNKIPATFAQGSSTIVDADEALIKRIVSYLAANPNASIVVKGYASSDGSLEMNRAISAARASAFKHHLIARNIDEHRIQTFGKGIANPVATNKTSSGRAKNRRVEIVFE